MARNNKDYIPTQSEYIAQQEALRAYQNTHEDPRHPYKISYNIILNGNKIPYSNTIMAFTAEEAEQSIKKQCMQFGGFYPHDLTVTEG